MPFTRVAVANPDAWFRVARSPAVRQVGGDGVILGIPLVPEQRD
jgi:hypothetical protein